MSQSCPARQESSLPLQGIALLGIICLPVTIIACCFLPTPGPQPPWNGQLHKASQAGPIRGGRRNRGLGEGGHLGAGGDNYLEQLSQVDTTTGGEFRFSARNYFLTWSQIGDLPNDVLTEKMQNFSTKIKTWAAAEEHHQDGGRHWHAFIMFEQKLRGRNPTIFDIQGIHPNIRASKGNKLDQVRIWNYLNKEGWNTFGPWEGATQTFEPTSAKEGIRQALNATSREDFMAQMREADPKGRLEYYAEKHFAKPQVEYIPPHKDFIRIPKEMKDWVEHELPKRDRPKCLVVWGPSRTGKTSWARSLGNHVYLNSAWSAAEVDEDKDYIIFDDIPFENFFNWQAFMGAQQQFIVTDKYMKKRTIRNWGKPCIWLNNRNPLEVTTDQWKRDWLQANCTFVNLEHKLWMAPPTIPPMFQPVARRPINLEPIEEEPVAGPSRMNLEVDKDGFPSGYVEGLGYVTYMRT
ncbi:hypothetical protein F5148DRAFT_1153368 [Russula earlei]|uniref:Uncharacterized protein n=1 Tax=Russula earlei TaxID=71964 RepID=A0ACC0TVL0_9AGAM|nr:hypothetical protein F5148DRAFT_1153368 [Russula earlei]